KRRQAAGPRTPAAQDEEPLPVLPPRPPLTARRDSVPGRSSRTSLSHAPFAYSVAAGPTGDYRYLHDLVHHGVCNLRITSGTKLRPGAAQVEEVQVLHGRRSVAESANFAVAANPERDSHRESR